jgi:hypothetical protein
MPEKTKKKKTLIKTIESTDDKIWCQVSYGIQLAAYEPFKVDLGQSITLKPNDDPNELMISTMNKLTTMVMTHVEEVRENPADYIDEDGD